MAGRRTRGNRRLQKANHGKRPNSNLHKRSRRFKHGKGANYSAK